MHVRIVRNNTERHVIMEKLKKFFLGRTLRDADLNSEKFSVLWGLPIYSSDAISSVAYAGEEILLVLMPVLFLGSYKYFLLCVSAIVLLLCILVFSYRQTIDAYPQGGGAYAVTTENLGKIPGLVAGAALIIGYILTVATSVAAATAAIYSAVPAMASYRVLITLLIVCLLTWGNLRGMRESSVLFGTPTYLFVIVILVMIAVGLAKYFFAPGSVPTEPTFSYTESLKGVSLFLVLRAFGSGCTALTGVEAVSNAVPTFRDPSTKHAKQVLGLLALIIFVVFLGVSVLTALYKITPDPSGHITAIAQLAGRIFGQGSAGFYIVQFFTVVILALAANTAFAGMPVLLALIAQDGYAPRKMTARGTKLSFSNGIVLLFAAACILIIIFNADTHLLLPLYATGVFLSFTLSQTGMLVRWHRLKTPGWRHKAFINGVGAAMSGTTCVIIAVSKFTAGAWMVLVALPVLVCVMLLISRHYKRVSADLSIDGQESKLILDEAPTVKVIIPLGNLNRAFVKALNYAMSIRGADIELYHISSSGEDTQAFRARIAALKLPVTLVIETTEYRNYNELLLRHIDDELSRLEKHQMLTVVMSQIVLRHWWQRFLHNQTSEMLKRRLEHERNVSVIIIPYLL